MSERIEKVVVASKSDVGSEVGRHQRIGSEVGRHQRVETSVSWT